MSVDRVADNTGSVHNSRPIPARYVGSTRRRTGRGSAEPTDSRSTRYATLRYGSAHSFGYQQVLIRRLSATASV